MWSIWADIRSRGYQWQWQEEEKAEECKIEYNKQIIITIIGLRNNNRIIV